MNRKMIAGFSLIAACAALVGYGFAAVTLQSSQSVTIKEALVISPSSANVSIYPGQSFDLNFSVTNLSTASIPVTVAASSAPTSQDVALTIQQGATQTMSAGANTVQVRISLDTSAAGGIYTVTLSLVR